MLGNTSEIIEGLRWYEQLAWLILCRSKRVGLVIVKIYGEHAPLACRARKSDPGSVSLAMAVADELEPPSLQLERLYHAPSYGEGG